MAGAMTSATGNRNRGGAFTLVEILVAVAILAVGIVSIMGVFNAYVSALCDSGDRMRSAMLMKERISMMELEGPRCVSAGRFPGTDAGFSWRTEIHPAGRPSGAAVNEIVVSVWRDGKEHAAYSLTTYARGSPGQ